MMNDDAPRRSAHGRLRIGAAVAILAALLALFVGCAPLRELFYPSAPGVPAEWAGLIDEIRTFEEEIGFRETDNFVHLSEDQESYPFCGHAPRLILPYSYEDPAIEWHEVETEQECLKLAAGADMYFGTVEAIGEIGTPVTLSMVDSKLDRFLYLVIHEDCHDQYELPYGIEEALCNLIAYKAMAVFADRKFGEHSREVRAIRRYAMLESRRTRATKEYYDQLAVLYERHRRKDISTEALMTQRGHVLATAQRSLATQGGEFNNVVLASHMTYSRHYPFLESVFDALGGDLARTVEFFRRVDRSKPASAAIMGREKIASENSLEFIRAYESAVVATAERELREEQGRRRDRQ